MPNGQDWYPNLTGRLDPIAEQAIRKLFELSYGKQKSISGIHPPSSLSFTEIAKALSAGGSNALSITGLVGQASQPQLSKVPQLNSAPLPGNPLSQPNTLVEINGVLNILSSNGGIQNPGIWQPAGALGVKLEDTHANRLSKYPPGNFPIGVLFYETDRNVFYENDGTYGSSAWTYKLGTMRGTLNPDQRPTLGTDDAGFLFYGTDWKITYRWSGSIWEWYSGIYFDIFANRPTLPTGNDGFIFFAADYKIAWSNLGGAWFYSWGILSTVPKRLFLVLGQTT